MGHRTPVMWIEYKGDGLAGPARIGRVTYSKTGRSLTYDGRTFKPVTGYKYNHVDVETGEHYWISGCHRDGNDALYSTTVEIDEDVREEYWVEIRQLPELKHVRRLHTPGKYAS